MRQTIILGSASHQKGGMVFREGYDPSTKDYKSSVLPIKLPEHMVRLARLELATDGLKGRYSTTELQSHTSVQYPRPHKHLEPKGQTTLAVISRWQRINSHY